MATLINGNGNYPVTAQQDADLYQGILGGDFVKMLPVGNMMAYTITDANTITLSDGECIDSEGRRIHIDVGNTDSFTIPTGTSGQTVYYIIGYILAEDSDGNETASTFVEEVDSADSTIDEESLRDGASSKYVSLYRVTQESLSITEVTALFQEATGLADISEVIGDAFPFDLAISNGTYGYLDTSGEFHSFRCPTGNAVSSQVLSGAVFSNATSDDITGSMTNCGNVSTTLNCGSSYTIPTGFHAGGGVVKANSLASQTVANAAAAYILNGYTAYVNGSKITGTMNNCGDYTETLSSNTVSLPAGYYESVTINAAEYLADYMEDYTGSLSVSNSTTVSWNSGWVDGGGGAECITYGSFTLKLTLSNGTITAGVSGTAHGGGAKWEGSSWTATVYSSASIYGSSTGSI